jgi:hypothetical protein
VDNSRGTSGSVQWRGSKIALPLISRPDFFRFANLPASGIIQIMETDVIVKIVVIGSVIVAAGLYFYLYR